jgi:cytidylate kinase
MENILVTISRQFGCGGAYIGRRLAKRLGYVYVDREILQQAARTLGVGEPDLAVRDERASSFWENLFRGFVTGSPEIGYTPPPIPPIYDKDLFHLEATIITKVADERSAVIVGRGGFHVLKRFRGSAHVFLHAAIDFRIKRVMEVYKIKERGEARSLIDESDRERRKYLRTMTGADWNDARNYHLCVDVSRAGFPAAEEMIVKLLEGVRQRLTPS